MTITGGIFNENVYLAEEAPETVVVVKEDATFNGYLELPQVELTDIFGANILLGNELNMNFYYDVSNPGTTAKLVRSYADGRADDVREVVLSECEKSGNYYKITYDGLCAKEMGDEINVTIYDDNGQAVSNVYTDSIRIYVNRVWNSNPGDEVRTLFVDMLNYGAASQINFHYNEEDLANSWLTDEQKAYATTDVVCEDGRVIGVGADTYYGTSFVLENRISMNVYFRRIAVSAWKDMKAIVTFTHHDQKQETTVEISGDEFINSDGFLVVRIDEIVAADGRQPVTCKLLNADGEVVAEVTDSLESYVARNRAGYPWLAEIMKYSDAAYDYLH